VPIVGPPEAGGGLMFWFDAEYLRWYVKKMAQPLLLTSGNANDFLFGVAGTVPGALGSPSTIPVLGQFSGANGHNGLRLTAGVWLDPEQVLGVQGSYFWLDQQKPSFSISGDGSTNSALIVRPFFNTATNMEDADPVLVPTVTSGGITISNYRTMMGADANLVYNYLTSSITGMRFAFLVGARFLALDEKVLIDSVVNQLPDVLGDLGPTTTTSENFTTYNRFYGAQVGGQFEYMLGPVYVEFIGKVALGGNNQVIKITGMTTQVNPPDPVLNLPPVVASNTGLLVQPGNSGVHSRNVFSVVPEGRFTMGYIFNENVMFKASYDCIIWNQVARAGDYIDRRVNIQPLGDNVPVQPVSPQFTFHTSNFWVMGVSLGLEFSF
jgi:hypothetical protein